MDLNDFEQRLKRIYKDIGAIYDFDIQKHMIQKNERVEGTLFKHSVTFGGDTEEEKQNRIIHSVHALASIKDHIKNRLKDTNQNPQLIENAINSSSALAVLNDLDNLDKHGRNRNRSRKNPEITEVYQALSMMPGQKKGSISMTFDGTNSKMSQIDGDFRIITSAKIVDGNSNELFKFDSLLEQAMKETEDFIEKHKLKSR